MPLDLVDIISIIINKYDNIYIICICPSNIFPANHFNFLISHVYSAERFPFTLTMTIFFHTDNNFNNIFTLTMTIYYIDIDNNVLH